MKKYENVEQKIIAKERLRIAIQSVVDARRNYIFATDGEEYQEEDYKKFQKMIFELQEFEEKIALDLIS